MPFVELLLQLLPVLLPLITQLINKPKPQAVEWCQRGAQASLAEKKPVQAFWFGSLACAFEQMTDEEYQGIAAGVSAAAAFAAAKVKGGAK